ncbi:MAG: anthranilate phosphoribosyltransferase [Nitriliruptorales bacterium]|nr:anthranilate phosphoribosyltransferase [Nitriliruptorales bacterium]
MAATPSASPVDWSRIIESVLSGAHLPEDDAADVMDHIMAGDAVEAQIAGLLVALRSKGESASEIAGFVRSMVAAATPIELEGPLLDTCGTGGDGAGTFNISTLAAVVCAAAGVKVAKHGNRAASGQCGSADLLEAWGVVIDLPPAAVATTVRELGIGFLYARSFHPAMRHVAPVRGHLGIRTVFNVLGPLSNPAGATRQVVGVADKRLAPVMAEALARLGKEHAFVFRGEDGLDELTTTGPSQVWEVRGGVVEETLFDPKGIGLERARLEDLQGGSVDENVSIADAVLAGERGPAADIVALNAGAGMYVAGVVDRVAEGTARAVEVLESGAAAELRDRWVARSQELAEEA